MQEGPLPRAPVEPQGEELMNQPRSGRSAFHPSCSMLVSRASWTECARLLLGDQLSAKETLFFGKIKRFQMKIVIPKASEHRQSLQTQAANNGRKKWAEDQAGGSRYKGGLASVWSRHGTASGMFLNSRWIPTCRPYRALHSLVL